MIKKTTLSFIIAVACSTAMFADEGMWLLPRLKQHNEAAMQRLGLKLTADEVADKLGKAIILFNGNGTASFVSKDGLILTNHHCARSGIQKASSERHNYLRDGFWADCRQHELLMPGLTMTVNRAVSDVSTEVNKALKQAKPSDYYKTISAIANKHAAKYPGCKARISSYRNNTLHILYVTQTFSDLRLVGVAPYEIAKFGGETDNWTWPRHGCDFAILRAYVSPDGKSTKYAKNNVPYHPEAWLNVATEGIGEGDFAMSMGYPGHTDRRATSMQVWEWRNVLNPPLVRVRTARQQVIEKYMRSSETLHIKYADKFAESANYCKNYGGMNEWIDRLDLCKRKAEAEQAYANSIDDETKRQEILRQLDCIDSGIRNAARYRKATQYYIEVFNNGIEMLAFVSGFGNSVKSMGKENYVNNVRMHYKDYDEQVDRDVAKALLRILVGDLDSDLLCPTLQTLKAANDPKAIDNFIDSLYDNSSFANEKRLTDAVNRQEFKADNDPALKLTQEIELMRREISRTSDSHRETARKAINSYRSAYDKSSEASYYPDADKTIRLSYGSVCTLPVDGIVKPWQTTLAGVIEKNKIDNPDYHLPDRLTQLWRQGDFGRWDIGGDVPACFITNGDVTGGNSGSPMINGKGELTGLVFDCNWESMLRDFHFDKSLHRVICLDVRYLMFIAEKYGNAKWIIDEMINK